MIGIIVIALFGVAGAAVAGGQMSHLIGSAAPADPTASAPIASPAPSPSRTPDSTRTPTPPTLATPTPAPPPTAPVSPAETPCATDVLSSIWAHYDDDLIFANPALQDAMAAGACIRTVFLTASDAGRGSAYSQKRELGILRAYNTMRGQEGFWSEKRVTLLSGAVLSQWSPDGDPDITVAFLRLPDGNLAGDGFGATGNVGLPKLLDGVIPALAPIDGGPAISSETLVASLAEVVQAYHATLLMTHVPSTAVAWTAGDHADHAAAGTYARAAWQRAGFPAGQVSYAIGYPTAELPANLSGDILTRKLAPYRVYSSQDPVVSCATDEACLAKPSFGQWLQRHYLKSDAELFPAG
jgi:LmbE family N-acetylglucosaminyl deacetylase